MTATDHREYQHEAAARDFAGLSHKHEADEVAMAVEAGKGGGKRRHDGKGKGKT